MFLLRCLFWLGLVFSQIAQLEGTGAAPFFGQAGALGQQAGALEQQGGGWGQMAAQAAERQCRANPAQCLAQASSVAKAALALNSAKSDGAVGTRLADLGRSRARLARDPAAGKKILNIGLQPRKSESPDAFASGLAVIVDKSRASGASHRAADYLARVRRRCWPRPICLARCDRALA